MIVWHIYLDFYYINFEVCVFMNKFGENSSFNNTLNLGRIRESIIIKLLKKIWIDFKNYHNNIGFY